MHFGFTPLVLREDGMSISRLNDNLIELSKRTGYKIIQENGQRKTGPPPFWTGPPPPRGCEVFIGKVPRNVFEDELFPLFQTAGIIYEFRLMMDFSCSNRGFAFATYATKEEAQRAIFLLNGYEIRPGRRIGVLKSVDNCVLYIGGLPTNKSRDEIYEEISRHTGGVSKVIVHSCTFNAAKNRGFAFVEYESHRAASLARKILIPGNVKLFDCEIVVDWAATDEVPVERKKSSTVLYVHGIPVQISEGYLLYLFSFQGGLPICRIKKIRDFAFVHYFTTCDAEFAMNKLNGFNLSGSVIQITWAKSDTKSLSENNNVFNSLVQSRASNPNSVKSFQNRQCEKYTLQNNPVKVLSEVCQANDWGDPVYHVVHSSSSVDEIDTTFSAKVYIPYLPLPVKLFTVPEVFISPKEAKNFVAEYTLKIIATFSNDQNHLAATPCHMQNSSPMTPYRNSFKEICDSSASYWSSQESQSSVDNYKNCLSPASYTKPNSLSVSADVNSFEESCGSSAGYWSSRESQSSVNNDYKNCLSPASYTKPNSLSVSADVNSFEESCGSSAGYWSSRESQSSVNNDYKNCLSPASYTKLNSLSVSADVNSFKGSCGSSVGYWSSRKSQSSVNNEYQNHPAPASCTKNSLPVTADGNSFKERCGSGAGYWSSRESQSSVISDYENHLAVVSCLKQNSLPVTHDVNSFKESCGSSECYLSSPELQSSVNNDFIDQDGFLNLLATAASLASVQLQTNTEPEQMFKMESTN